MANKDKRICIIGGGPAGQTVAMYLEKKGYDKYVIYVKLNRVGGKCFSPKMKMGPKMDEERTIEMGAVMGCDTYFAVAEAEKFGGASHIGGPAMGRKFMTTEGKELKKGLAEKLNMLLKLNKMTKLLKKK